MSQKLIVFGIFIILMTLSPAAGARSPSQAPNLGNSIRGLSAGLEMMVLVDFNETETFNPGVKEKDSDRIRVTQDPRRSEKLKFGQQFTLFEFDGSSFHGIWRSAPFQNQYFIEFIEVSGLLAKDKKTVKKMTLTKIRFDKASLSAPVNRGTTAISVIFRDLQLGSAFGNRVSYRFEKGKSKVAVTEAAYEYLEEKYHSVIETKWSFVKIDEGSNPVSQLPYTVFGNVDFENWGRSAPPESANETKTVTVVGNWRGAAEVIAWLSGRKGVKIIDKTTKVQNAVNQEKELATAGLLAEVDPGVQVPESTDNTDSPEDLSKYKGIVVELKSTGTDVTDGSASARIRDNDSENDFSMNLDPGQFREFGNGYYQLWASWNSRMFVAEITSKLRSLGL